jgi:hypothetical protein
MLDRYNVKASQKRPTRPIKAESEEAVVFAQSAASKPKASTPATEDDESTKTCGSKSVSSVSKSSSSASKSSKSKHPTFKCLTCGQIGHVSTICPSCSIPAQVHVTMHTNDASQPSNDEDNLIICATTDNVVNPNYLLLDSQSACNQFVNLAFLTNF